MRISVIRALLVALAICGCARVESQKAATTSRLEGGLHFATTAPPAGTSGRNPALVSTILVNRCASCHGPGTSAYGGIDYISNLYRLIVNQEIIPGNPTDSLIFQMASGKGPCGPAIPDAELKAISDWISGLHPRVVNRGR